MPGTFSPAFFLTGRAMRELSVFVDEPGSDGSQTASSNPRPPTHRIQFHRRHREAHDDACPARSGAHVPKRFIKPLVPAALIVACVCIPFAPIAFMQTTPGELAHSITMAMSYPMRCLVSIFLASLAHEAHKSAYILCGIGWGRERLFLGIGRISAPLICPKAITRYWQPPSPTSSLPHARFSSCCCIRAI